MATPTNGKQVTGTLQTGSNLIVTPCVGEDFDGTDGACPAWWRGHHDSVVSVVRIVNNILDDLEQGKDPEVGHFGYEGLNQMRSRLKNLFNKDDNTQ